MDLNLYLGLSYSRRPRSLDLGSDLSLSSLPMSTSTSTSSVESISPVAMPSSVVLAEPQITGFCTHPEYTPNRAALAAEYNPYFPSYESYRASLVPISAGLSEVGGPSSPYSPPILQPSPAVEELQETETQVVESDMPFDSVSVPRLGSESIDYSPPYVSGSDIRPDEEDANFSLYSPIRAELDHLIAAEDRFPLTPEHIRSPRSRIRRLIESSNRWPIRRFRSSLAHAVERPSFRMPSSPNPEEVLRDTSSPERVCETNASSKVPGEDNVVEALEEKRDEQDKAAANFECNICFDMATEPVVTSCGHLFCWPCLYQWLHVHSDHNECPVCKGEVAEGKITPIYGRGSSNTEKEKSDDPLLGLNIPPRPRGSRLESLRQQFHPVARRFSEGIASWRRLIDYHMRSRNRYGPPSDSTQQELIDIHHRSLSRLRARRLQRDVNPQNAADNGELGMPRSSSSIQNLAGTTTSSVFQEFLHPLSLHGLGTERLAVVTAGIGRMFEQFTGSSNRHGASTSAEPPRSEPQVSATLAADQISASSTMAVIQGDNATSDAMPDPNSAGTSRSYRRRGRSSSSGSFDVDGGNLHPCKRRRLN